MKQDAASAMGTNCFSGELEHSFFSRFLYDAHRHELRTPNEAFFYLNPEILGLGSMALPVVKFSRQGYKIGKVFA